MFDATTLKAVNSYKLVESKQKHNFGPSVHILKATNGSYRFCYVSQNGCCLEPYGACLVVDETGTIESVYTMPEHRRQGIAKQLLAIAKVYVGDVKHSDNLTTEGRLWRDSVESLK